jgi:hypothetical protein
MAGSARGDKDNNNDEDACYEDYSIFNGQLSQVYLEVFLPAF